MRIILCISIGWGMLICLIRKGYLLIRLNVKILLDLRSRMCLINGIKLTSWDCWILMCLNRMLCGLILWLYFKSNSLVISKSLFLPNKWDWIVNRHQQFMCLIKQGLKSFRFMNHNQMLSFYLMFVTSKMIKRKEIENKIQIKQ